MGHAKRGLFFSAERLAVRSPKPVSLRLDGDAGRAAHDAAATELDEAADSSGGERYGVGRGRDNGKGRRGVGVDRRVRLAAGVARQAPVDRLVWHIVMASGRVAAPVFAFAVIVPPPTLTVATAKALDPDMPGMCRMPSFRAVAASVTTSGTAVGEAEYLNVSMPKKIGAAFALAHEKLNCKSIGGKGALGVRAMT